MNLILSLVRLLLKPDLSIVRIKYVVTHAQTMYVERDLMDMFTKLDRNYPVIAVVGPRQSGKTTFLKMCMERRGGASYVLFDDPDARDLFEEDVKGFEQQYIDGYERTVLDEVQYCRKAGQNMKYLADTGSRLWVTSSSETVLGKEVLSHLVGRVSILRLFPFSLAEFLRAKGLKVVTSKALERSIREHMTYGGYPKIVMTKGKEMKERMLMDLYRTMLLADVARMFSISDIGALERCARYLSVNAGSVLSYETAAGHLGLSFPTLKKYLDAMEQGYLIARAPPFFRNRSKEIVKRPKVFFLDTGMRNAVAGSFGPEARGNLFENYIYTELVKAGFAPRYWRTKGGSEVDLVVEIDGIAVPIEVKTSVIGDKVEPGLRAFIAEHGPKRAYVVFLRGNKGRRRVGGGVVEFTDVCGLLEAVK